MRVGPNTQPDYGLVVGADEGLHGRARRGRHVEIHVGRIDARDLVARRCASACCIAARRSLRSITDEHFRGCDAASGVRPRCARADSGSPSLALASGEPVYGLGEKFGPLNKRGQLIHSHVVDALGVNTGLAYKNVPFAWSPGTGKGAWGVFVHTPASVTHGVGHPDWSHRSYAIARRRRGARPLRVRRGHAGGHPRSVHAAHRAARATVPLWSLGLWVSRAYYKTPEEAAAVAAKLRAHKIPCDVLTLDGRAAWDVETRFDFEWDPDALSGSSRRARRDQGSTTCGSACGNIRTCRCTRRCSWSSRRAATSLTTADGDPYVFGWDTAPGTSPFGKVLTPLPESGIVDFTHPGAYVWWRDAHAPLFADGVDVIKSDFGEQVPDDAVAFNGDSGRRLHNVYPLLYNQCVFEATAKFQRDRECAADGVGPRRVDRQPALSDPVGRRSAKRLGRPRRVDPRRRLRGA